MHVVTDLAPYEDDDGNRIECDPEAVSSHLRITFRGSRNVVRIGRRARLDRVDIVFDCSDGIVEIAEGGGALSINVRVGQDSRIILGRNVTSTSVVGMSATEGTTIRIGDDVMFASENQVRADDGHPIFDVRTGKRVNVSRDITIGNHVWIGWGTWVLGGSVVGDGSVLGTGAILKGRIPNNVVAVGVPAKVVRKDIAWERPHLSLVEPYYKPDASTIKKSRYWNVTVESGTPHPVRRAQNLGGRMRRFGGRVRRKLSRMLKR